MANGVGTTHHIKLGGQYFLIKQGSYRKRPAPIFGARFTTGDPDYNTLSFWQHWVQRCWIGGFGAQEWQDDAMFDKSAGVDTSYHEVLLLSRDLGPNGATRSTDNWQFSLEAAASYQREFFTWNGVDDSGTEGLYCLTWGALAGNSWLHRYRNSTSDWVAVHTFTSIVVRSQARWRNRIYFGTSGSTLAIMEGNPGSETFTTVAKPSGVTDKPYAMLAFRDRLYVGFGSDLWRMLSDGTWDGSTVFYSAPGINYFTRMEPHLGFLYIASRNGHILRTDGNNTFDLWSMESDTRITGLRSFDGRLFVACVDPLEGTNASEAVLFQFSGSAVTELKRLGEIATENTMGQLRVVGSRMFFGASSLYGFQDGFGIGMYDVVEDSYHMFAVSRNTATYAGGTENSNWQVDDVIWYKGKLFCSVRGHGIFYTKYTVKDVDRLLASYDTTAAGASVGSKNGGWVETSEFDAGTPGLQKLWNALILDVDLPSTDTSVHVEYSLDGGNSWTVQGTATKTGSGRRYTKIFHLGGTALGGDYGTSIKVRMTLRTTDSTKTPAVRGFAVRYLPIPEPNWVWDMVLVLSTEQELLDGTTEASVDNDTKLAALETAFRAQSLVKFTDIDGTLWTTGDGPGVLIQSLDVHVPFIGPSSAGQLEREVRVSLIEAVETYDLP